MTNKVEIFLISRHWKKLSPRNQDGLRFADALPKGTYLSLICIGLKLQNLYLIQKQVKILVSYAHNWSPWKICLLVQTSCKFHWRLPQTLSHSHNVIFCPDWSWLSLNLRRSHFIVSGWSVSTWKVLPKLLLLFWQLILTAAADVLTADFFYLISVIYYKMKNYQWKDIFKSLLNTIQWQRAHPRKISLASTSAKNYEILLN